MAKSSRKQCTRSVQSVFSWRSSEKKKDKHFNRAETDLTFSSLVGFWSRINLELKKAGLLSLGLTNQLLWNLEYRALLSLRENWALAFTGFWPMPLAFGLVSSPIPALYFKISKIILRIKFQTHSRIDWKCWIRLIETVDSLQLPCCLSPNGLLECHFNHCSFRLLIKASYGNCNNLHPPAWTT